MTSLGSAVALRLPSISPTMIYPFLDWFIPAKIKKDQGAHQRARMFLISHLFGPFLGNTITVYLFWLEDSPDSALAILAGSISAFWLYPFALRLTGWYNLLAVISVQNLIFAIVWGCYQYGGVGLALLPLLLAVSPLAFFFFGLGGLLRGPVLCLLALNLFGCFMISMQGATSCGDVLLVP